MAKVCFRTNVGSIDAGKLGLDFTKCLKHAELDVSDAVAKQLQEANLADPVTAESKVKAVPKVEVKA